MKGFKLIHYMEKELKKKEGKHPNLSHHKNIDFIITIPRQVKDQWENLKIKK